MASDKKTAAGNTSMLLLQLLSERDMYGYEMIETLGKRSENLFELKAGTLYPLLHTMESQYDHMSGKVGICLFERPVAVNSNNLILYNCRRKRKV